MHGVGGEMSSCGAPGGWARYVDTGGRSLSALVLIRESVGVKTKKHFSSLFQSYYPSPGVHHPMSQFIQYFLSFGSFKNTLTVWNIISGVVIALYGDGRELCL